MTVARFARELEPSRPRAVALGTFDGVHLGHRRVLQAALDAGRARRRRSSRSTRTRGSCSATGRAALDARAAARAARGALGIEDVLVVEFTGLSRLGARGLRRSACSSRSGRGRRRGGGIPLRPRRARAISTLLRRLGFDVRPVPLVEGVSSSQIRAAAARGRGRGRRAAARAARRGRGHRRRRATRAAGRSASRPRTSRSPPSLLVPAYGIYAGAASATGAAVSIGTNPHYGGAERRVEAFLLDFEGDLYGQRLVVELWQRLRDEAVFDERAGAGRPDRPRRRGYASRHAPRVKRARGGRRAATNAGVPTAHGAPPARAISSAADGSADSPRRSRRRSGPGS